MAEGGGVDYETYFGRLIEILKKNPKMKQSAKGIAKHVAYSAGGTTIGGLLFGPAGALAGGIAGSVIGYLSSDDYDSMIKKMLDLSDSQKEKLVNEVQELVGNVPIEALVDFLTSERNQTALIQLILNQK